MYIDSVTLYLGLVKYTMTPPTHTHTPVVCEEDLCNVVAGTDVHKHTRECHLHMLSGPRYLHRLLATGQRKVEAQPRATSVQTAVQNATIYLLQRVKRRGSHSKGHRMISHNNYVLGLQ